METCLTRPATTPNPPHEVTSLRSRCQGITPLDARLETWQIETLQSRVLFDWIATHGSPLNLIHVEPLRRNIHELNTIAAERGIDFRIFLARKANKCLAFVDTATAVGAGIDTASEQELMQVLDRGIAGPDLICTAAIKNRRLLERCVQHQVVVALDNQDELELCAEIAVAQSRSAAVALRCSGFHHQGEKLPSRFGFDIDAIAPVLQHPALSGSLAPLTIRGLHFHLDGYSAAQRVSAVSQCLPLLDRLQAGGQRVDFLDIGGGLPMCYLEEAAQWDTFWAEHAEALLQRREPLTYRNHGLGLLAVNGELHGRRNCYPYYQAPVRAEWLAELLDAPYESGTIAEALRARNVQLRCEPGRSLLDGCGLTIAEVQFRKQLPTGDWCIGLSMNRTQCRTTSDDFLVDPLLIPHPQNTGPRPALAGYLVGAYCTESDLISLRKPQFPAGIAPGDLIALPNTAGYLMHFLESRSHQFPLAKNLLLSSTPPQLDDIDQTPEPPHQRTEDL